MKKIILFSVMCLTSFTFFSCTGAYTDISGTWTKPGYSGKKYNNILIVAITNDLVKRNTVESAMVRELKNDKIKASISTPVIDFSRIEKTSDGRYDTTKLDAVKKSLSDAGYDGAIVISLLDIKEKTEYVPGQTYYQPNYYAGYQPYAYNGFYNYSYQTYSVVNTPGYYVQKTNIFIEARLFDLNDNIMQWAAETETENPSDINAFATSLAGALTNKLVTSRIIK